MVFSIAEGLILVRNSGITSTVPSSETPGAVGRSQDPARGGRGDGSPEKHDPHAGEAHVRQASPDAAGGPGAACALSGRRSQVLAPKAKAAADRRSARPFSRKCPNNAGKPPENLRISPILGTRASVRLASSVIRIFRGGGCVGALKHLIADGMALPALLRAGRWKGADAVRGYTATSTDPGSRSPIPIRESMQTRQFQTPPAVRTPFVAPASATRGRRPSRLACGGRRRGPTSPARLRVLGNRSVNFTADKNRHGARKSLGALTGPSRAETRSSPAPPTSRPTPRVPAPAASLLRARAAVVAKNHSTPQAGFPQKAEGIGFV